MNKDDTILKYSLLACVFYFICMAVAHFFSFKYPILFIYYDVPFHAYQDKIISFAVVTYIILFYSAYKNRDLAPQAIFSLLTTVIGLSLVNLSDALASVLDGGNTMMYWLQTGMIFLIAMWLLVFHKRRTSK